MIPLITRWWRKKKAAVEKRHKDFLDPYKEICRVYEMLDNQQELTDSERELKHRFGLLITRTVWRNMIRSGFNKEEDDENASRSA